MRVFIRADASTEIGAGHTMRCLALSGELRDRGTFVAFICREHPGNLSDYIEKKGFVVHRLPLDGGWTPPAAGGDGLLTHASWLGAGWETDAVQVEAILAREGEHGPINWLIVDHYALDARWERRMRPYVKKIMVIDDNADKSEYEADIIVNPNIHASGLRYGCSPQTILLMGPKYALLRAEFRQSRRGRDEAPAQPTVLLSLGAADKQGATLHVMRALQPLLSAMTLVVIAGPNSVHRGEIYYQAAKSDGGVRLQENPVSMAEIMDECDLAICTPSTTLLECRARGLDCLVVRTADNQDKVLAWLAAWRSSQSPSKEGTEQEIHGLKLEICSHLSKLPYPICVVPNDAVVVDGEGARRIADFLCYGQEEIIHHAI